MNPQTIKCSLFKNKMNPGCGIWYVKLSVKDEKVLFRPATEDLLDHMIAGNQPLHLIFATVDSVDGGWIEKGYFNKNTFDLIKAEIVGREIRMRD